ncbi:hypothetical protein [Roseateles puraquae]|uniref:hypothetical protein n=1 Tax=Roseateles puraquae TaxID=431059 RepID=UPI0013032DCF
MNTMPASIFKCWLTKAKPHRASSSKPMLRQRQSSGTRATSRARTRLTTATSSSSELTSSGNRPGPAWAKLPMG